MGGFWGGDSSVSATEAPSLVRRDEGSVERVGVSSERGKERRLEGAETASGGSRVRWISAVSVARSWRGWWEVGRVREREERWGAEG